MHKYLRFLLDKPEHDVVSLFAVYKEGPGNIDRKLNWEIY